MINIKKLTLIQKQTQRVLLKDCTFSVLPHEKIGIIGEEGNGKSTLLKAILNPSSIQHYCMVSGTIQHDGLVIGMLPQQLPQQWNQISVWDFMLKEAPDSETAYQNIPEYYRLMAQYGLDEDRFHQKKCAECSGGEQIKLQLIKLELQHPDLYLLDEPTNDLDIDTLEVLESFMNDPAKTILFISHDETLLRNTATGILHLEQIKRKTLSRWTFESIPYDEYIEKRSWLKDRQNRISAKQHDEYRAKMDRYRRLYQQVDHALNTVSRQDPHTAKMLKKKMHTVKSMGKRLDKEKENLVEHFDGEEEINFFFKSCSIPPSKVMLDFKLDQLKLNDTVLSQNIRLLLNGQNKTAIIGKNGCGKSTLLKAIMRQLKDRGDVGYMPQNYEDLMDGECSVMDFLCKERDKNKQAEIQTILGSLKFTADEMNQSCKECSQGQKAKLYLIKLMLENKQFLILDEPTRNLSPLSTPVIRKALINFQGTILCVSHDRTFLEEVIDNIFVLDKDGLHELKAN